MNEIEFWKLNEGLPVESAAQELEKRLMDLDAENVASYQQHFDRCLFAAYKWDVWAAAYIIGGGCSDDAFMDFRNGLIARGKEVFETAVEEPDSLASLGNLIDEEALFQEAFGYVAEQVYENKTSNSIPGLPAFAADDPAGEDWDFDDEELCKQKFPKLCARFW